MSFFPDSHDFTISGGTFYNAQNLHETHYTSFASPASDNPTTILLRHIAIDTGYESTQDAYAPRCSPGTRQEVIGDILTWVGEVDTSPPIAWLSGPAGAGKTSVQRDVAVVLQGMTGDGESLDGPRRLAASYFFSGQLSSQSGSSATAPSTFRLDTIQPFIATIAYQMASTIPGLRQYIEEEIERDPAVFMMDVAVQARRVLMEPLQEWKRDLQAKEERLGGYGGCGRHGDGGADAEPAPATIDVKNLQDYVERAKTAPRTISVDGFDKIKDHQQRGQLLHTIRSLAVFKPFPLRFIIASRPELDLADIFTSDAFASNVHRIRLETYSSDGDVERYLRTEFARIRSTHPAKASLRDWPSDADIRRLVWKSSGQFIYATTILKFVDNPRRSPIELLRRAIDTEEGADDNDLGHLTELYTLYSLILAGTDVHWRPTLRRILRIIAYADRISAAELTPDFVDAYLSYPAGTNVVALCNLHSLIHVPSEQDMAPDGAGSRASDSQDGSDLMLDSARSRAFSRRRLHFFHRSFCDYLHSSSVPADLAFTVQSAYADLTQISCRWVATWAADDYSPQLSPMVMEGGRSLYGYFVMLLALSSPEGCEGLRDFLAFDLWDVCLLFFVLDGSLCCDRKPPRDLPGFENLERCFPNSKLYQSWVPFCEAESRIRQVWSDETITYLKTLTREERRYSPYFKQLQMLRDHAP